MAIKFPSDIENNNPNFAMVDSSGLRGTAHIINQLSETGSGVPSDKRKEGAIVFITSSQEYYGFIGTSSAGWDTPSNWIEIATSQDVFPFTGSAGVLGSLNVNGITTINTGSFNISIGHPDYQAFPSLDLGNTVENFGNVGLGAGTLFDLIKGSNNFAIGFASQFSLTSGSENVTIGASSFFRPTIGSNNVAIGSKALYQFTGSDNVAIGNQALYGSNGTTGEGDSANNGSFNVAVGSLAHHSSNGSYNVAIGYKSFENHATGSNNVAIGSQTARITVSGGPDNFTYGNNSVYIGASVKPYANNAENETLIGSGTEGIGPNSVVLGNSSVTTTILKGNVGIGINNPTKKLEVANSDILVNDMTIGLGNGQIPTNVVLGKGAFASNTTGKDTIAIGENALASNIDTDGNLAIGQEALFNTVNNNNTGIGYRTLYNNTSGSRNTAIGRQALEDNTTGDRNTGIGQRAAEGNSVGNDNTAIGDRALVHNRSGSFNIAIGTDAARGLDQNTDFSSITAIGAFALQSLASGSANTAIGVSSLLSLHSGSNNISIGNLSAYAFESGSNNVFIGGYNGNSHNISNNNIFISDGEGNIRLFVTGSNGNTGIGTVLPSEKLTVEGNISASGYISASEGSFGIGATTINTNINTTGDITGSKLVLTSAGNVSNMSLHKSGDATTGLYFPGPSTVALQAGGGNIELSLSPNFLNTKGSLNHIGSITSSVDIKASGDITGDKFIVVNGGNSENVSIYKSGDITTGLFFPAPETIAITAAGGDIEFQVSEGLITTEGSLLHTGNITSSANISASGDIIGNTGSFNNINVTGEYTLPTSDGSANQIIQTNGSGILSFTTPTPVPTIYTPDVYEIQSVTGITSTNTLLTFRGSGDPTVIDGTTGTTRTTGVDDSITFNSEGIFEISYSVQMQQGASTGGTRMNPQVYAKFGTSGATAVAAGSSNVTYIRLIGSNQAPNGACTCTFYINVTDPEHILELLVAFTQPAANIDLDIVQFSSVQNTISIRKIT